MGLPCLCSPTIVTLSRKHGDVLSWDDRVDLKLVASINSWNNCASNTVQIASFNCSDLNYLGRMESDHGLAPGAMRVVTRVWWSDQPPILAPNHGQFLQPQQSEGQQNLHAHYSDISNHWQFGCLLNNKTNHESTNYWSFVTGNLPTTSVFPLQRASNTQSLFKSWHHGVYHS